MANEPLITLRRANLTADPQFGQTQSGRQILRLRVACNTAHRDQNNQWHDDTAYFFGITLWDMSQISLYRGLRKGDTVAVRGLYRETQGEDQNGNPVTYRNIDMAEVALLHGPKNTQNGPQQPSNTAWQRGQAYANSNTQQAAQRPQTAVQPPAGRPQANTPQSNWTAPAASYTQGAGFDDGGQDAF